jgi:CO/xanthine dehydrogenase Mo-binding subunit
MAAYAYLLARKSGRNVRLVYGRSEDIAYTTKRHPARITYRGAVDGKGRIEALSVRFDIDAGAYATLSPVVLSRGTLHSCGFYDIPHIGVVGRALATNTPPAGAFRGFGAPQAIFGIERFMDDVARELGIDSLSFRRFHLPGVQSTSLTGASLEQESKRLNALLERAVSESDYVERHQALHGRRDRVRRGIGMALFMHGGGFTGSGEKMLASRVRLEAKRDGTVAIRIINTEMGQGAATVLPQIVAQELEIGIGHIIYETPNTFTGAPSGPTVASRTTMVVGDLLRRAAHRLKAAVGEYTLRTFAGVVQTYLKNGGEPLFEAAFEQPEGVVWDEERYRGEAYLGYSLGCYVAEVSIDPVSCRASVTAFYALNDIGEVVNETLARGQVQGGIVQALGYALQEEVLYREGRVLNPRLSDYMIPIASDIPPVEVFFMDSGEKAMGLGELPMDGAGAAIANALSDALGIDISELPATPQKIMERMQ